MMRLHLLFVWIILSACGPKTHKESDISKDNNYSTEISKYGAVSIFAVDLASNEVLLAKNPQQRMTPASLTKIFTSGAALNVLSPEFRYRTKFYLQKHGAEYSLMVVGCGDPTLGSDRFEDTKPEVIFKQLYDVLNRKGIKRITHLYVDNSCYNGIKQPSKRLWEDMANYYGAVPNGLSYRENTFTLTLHSPKGVGSDVKIVKTEPELSIGLKSYVKSAANNKDSAYIYGHPHMKEWYVSGTIPQGRKAFKIKGALPQPELVFAQELNAFLLEKGVEITGEIRYSKNETFKAQLIHEHLSPRLSDIIAVVNKKSNNLYADHLLFTLSERGAAPNWDNGVRALSNYWQSEVAGFEGSFFDGSGLSPFNAVSAQDMVKVLTKLNQSVYADAFMNSLSVAGVDGTLRSILKDEDFKGRVIGKSGSMNGVLCYCGYLQTVNGQSIAFCIMANRFTESFKELRMNMEQVMKELILHN